METLNQNIVGICLSRVQDGMHAELVRVICESAARQNLRVQMFNAYSDLSQRDNNDFGEQSVFSLIRYELLAGLVLLSDTIQNGEVLAELCQQAQAAGVPVVSIGRELQGCYSMLYDSENAFAQMIRHVVGTHGCRRVDFIAGKQGEPVTEAQVAVYENVLQECGLHFEPFRLKYGEGEEWPVVCATNELLDDEVPEAILCADDHTAMAVCDALKKLGFRVPDDVLVIGFDGTARERYHTPQLTTSERDLRYAGELAVETILRARNEGAAFPPQSVSVPYTLQYTQSCGCQPMKDRGANAQVRVVYQQLEDRCRYENDMFTMMARMTDGHDLLESMQQLEPYLLALPADRIQVCLTGLCLQTAAVQFPDRELTEEDAGSVFVVAERTHDAYTQPMTVFSYRQQTEDLEAMFSWQNQMIFLPLHEQEVVFGYMAIAYNPNEMDYGRLFTFTMHFSHSLSTLLNRSLLLAVNAQLRQTNHELENMYIHDSMTGLYNRRGFFQELKRCSVGHMNGESWLYIASINMDSLKVINDTYGHGEGDFALKAVAEVITNCAGEKGICARFSGDEYMVAIITQSPDADGCFTYPYRLNEALEVCNQRITKNYRIVASCGTEIAVLSETLNIDDMMRNADNQMYHEKANRKSLRGSQR